MSDINVMLSTTGHTVAADMHVNQLRESNIPVCLADMSMAVFGFAGDLEPFEHRMAEMSKGMAKTVVVDSKARTVFIGVDPHILESGLVEYTDDVKSVVVDDFFKRWDETHMMIFEFTIFGKPDKERFVIKGLWEKDHWYALEITASQNIKVLPSRE